MGASVYLKMRILGAIESADGRSRIARIKNIAKLVFIDDEGIKKKFTWRTISTWYYRYKVSGVTSVEKKERKDKGLLRKTAPEELMEAINKALPYFKDGVIPSKAAIYRLCIKEGFLRREQVAPNTFSRSVNKYDLLDKSEAKSTIRLAFAMPYANDLWQCDTMVGPYVEINGKKVQAVLIAFIDDASRVICHGEFFASENTDALMKTLQMALYKRGAPKAIYADNGKVYCSKELTLVCTRIGCILRHTPVRDGAAKGKIERFFRRVRQQFLALRLDLSSLGKLNQQFSEWVENDYNYVKHSTLQMTPVDRFAIDRHLLTFLPETNAGDDELFYVEETRKVGKDNTFRLNSKCYETPKDLVKKEIQVRFQRSTQHKVIVYYKGSRMGDAKVLDLVGNSNCYRPKKKG
jgi:hypothetical protein